MIERFVAALETLRVESPPRGAGQDWDRRRPDWADAVRLQMDCMQQELDVHQRLSLRKLLDALEADRPDWGAVSAAARTASSLLGLIP